MLVNVGPILIAVLAGFVLHEGFPRALLAGCLIAFAGAVVIGIATSDHGLVPSWGAVLCVVAAVAYAGGVVTQKPLLARMTAAPGDVGRLHCRRRSRAFPSQDRSGTTPPTPRARRSAGRSTWASFRRRSVSSRGRTRSHARRPGRMGSTTYLVTPIAILLGWLLLGETPPALALLGGALCLAGVAVARRVQKPS